MSIGMRAKAALRGNFPGLTDIRGYMRWPQENLLPGVALEKVEDDLRRGDGDELGMKFCAVHSSAALAVNCFATFKDRPGDVLLLGQHGAKHVEFERKLSIFRGGKGPNIDVWIDRDRDAVAVESKLLEYLGPTKPSFSTAYERMAPPRSASCWWHVYQEAKQGTAQHLDRAQLIKHYFGLDALRKKSHQGLQLTLLYIFWEPLNWHEVDECKQHRDELKVFADAVSESQIPFRWMTYNQLWEEWAAIPALSAHASNLKARYQVCL